MKNFNSTIYDNPFRTRDDVKRGLEDLLAPLPGRRVRGGYCLGNTAAHYPPEIALMEGFSRSLWGIGPYVAGGGVWPGFQGILSILKEGTDPSSPGYWGKPGSKDQRLVEMASIALALMISRGSFWDPLNDGEKENLRLWLSHIETAGLPPNNWHFFRVLVCAAFRELGLPVNEKAEKESLDLIENCYRGDGWYQDGEGGNYDFYNPMGFHFYGLLWARLEGAREPERAKKYLERARAFGSRFASWFAGAGPVIPMGRSLGYRFAPVSFFSACAFAGLEVIPWGNMKGLVLRNLRWWFSRPILDAGGILSIGYGYPNLIMADKYNSPGSPYWGLKAWLVLALGEDHPFWKAREDAPLNEAAPQAAKIFVEKVPGFVLANTGEDAQLLSAGVFNDYEMNHAASKYGKFAYSAKAAFCAAHSNYDLEMCPCDSALVLSEGDGYWRERRTVSQVKTGANWVSSLWQPWADVKITTILVSLGEWHLRFHKIESGRFLIAAEGGFPIARHVPPWEQGTENPAAGGPRLSNAAPAPWEALVALPWGSSRIHALEKDSVRQGSILIPAPNLNILYPQAAVPVLEGKLEPGTTRWISAVRRDAGGRDRGSEDPPGAELPSDYADAF
jgi:hypothetical protein